MAIAGRVQGSRSESVATLPPPARSNSEERQAKFIAWVTAMFGRAHAQGIMLDRMTEFEMEWLRRM